jgi:CheY-like chemotaxis protein
MFNYPGDYNGRNTLNISFEVSVNGLRRSIGNYMLIALFCMIAAILFITFDQRFAAGCLTIAGVSLGVLVFRKSLALNHLIDQSLNDLSSLNEKKDDVINEFSHNIREPLNNLVTLVNIMKDSGLRNDQKELLETFRESTDNMVTAVNELTMQSAGNLGYEQRNAIRFNLLSTLLNTIELYSLKDNCNINFSVKNKGFSDFECFGDPIIVKQIFLEIFNTLENGGSDRDTKVKISLVKDKEERDISIFSISIHIDKNVVFYGDPGVDHSKTVRLITRINGAIHQEPGENFVILNLRLPFTNPVFKPEQQIASRDMAGTILKGKDHKELKDIKLLLVEDNPVNQKVTILTLQSLVRGIDTALNGQEALKKLENSDYDLILMDIQLPLMNGLQATEKIRELESSGNSHVPIIAITANAMIGDREQCLSAGMDDYISKPFQPKALIEIIKSNI